jgi:hypothetical protein
VTDPQSPLDPVLDLLIYAPLGLALTVVDEIPKLAARGRAQLGGQVATAKVVGQFAVAQSRQELGKRFSPPTPRGPATRPTDASGFPAASPGVAGPAGVRLEGPAEAGPSGRPTGQADLEGAPGPISHMDPPGPAPSPAELAIPGYDSLAASQVIQRLDGLSAEELAAVGAYESAHRARRTILSRVRQLQEG